MNTYVWLANNVLLNTATGNYYSIAYNIPFDSLDTASSAKYIVFDKKM